MSVTRFDFDPEALAWARSKVEAERDRWRNSAQREGIDPEVAVRYRRFSNLLDTQLIGGEGCVITPFDARRPDILRAVGVSAPPRTIPIPVTNDWYSEGWLNSTDIRLAASEINRHGKPEFAQAYHYLQALAQAVETAEKGNT